MIALTKGISWPTGEKLQSVVTKFSERNNFPGIVGALDGVPDNSARGQLGPRQVGP